jgi:hypothetical protein
MYLAYNMVPIHVLLNETKKLLFTYIFFLGKLRASRFQDVNRHLNYVSTPKHNHPIPISHNKYI